MPLGPSEQIDLKEGEHIVATRSRHRGSNGTNDTRLPMHPAASQWLTLWDGRQTLGWIHAGMGGMPVFRFRWAPGGLATRRQLRALRLSPGGQEPYALLVWRGGQRWAWLYRLDLAKPSRPASPAQLNALDKAMLARRTCRQCQRDAGYCVSTSDGRCAECMYPPDDLPGTDTDSDTGAGDDRNQLTAVAGGNEWLGSVA